MRPASQLQAVGKLKLAPITITAPSRPPPAMQADLAQALTRFLLNSVLLLCRHQCAQHAQHQHQHWRSLPIPAEAGPLATVSRPLVSSSGVKSAGAEYGLLTLHLVWQLTVCARGGWLQEF